jgi:hypothetical protein
MSEILLNMEIEKETKNAIRYKTVTAPNMPPPPITSVYVAKWAIYDDGFPRNMTVTVKPGGEKVDIE